MHGVSGFIADRVGRHVVMASVRELLGRAVGVGDGAEVLSAGIRHVQYGLVAIGVGLRIDADISGRFGVKGCVGVLVGKGEITHRLDYAFEERKVGGDVAGFTDKMIRGVAERVGLVVGADDTAQGDAAIVVGGVGLIKERPRARRLVHHLDQPLLEVHVTVVVIPDIGQMQLATLVVQEVARIVVAVGIVQINKAVGVAVEDVLGAVQGAECIAQHSDASARWVAEVEPSVLLFKLIIFIHGLLLAVAVDEDEFEGARRVGLEAQVRAVVGEDAEGIDAGIIDDGRGAPAPDDGHIHPGIEIGRKVAGRALKEESRIGTVRQRKM